jgi:hypothetical protein
MAPVPTRTAWVLLAWGLSLAALCCAPAASIAHDGGTAHARAAAGSTERALAKALGDDVEMRADGLYAVPGEDGEPLLTHGPDMLRAMPSGTATPGFSPGDPERDPACASDHYQHFIYAHAPDAPDRYEEVKAEIQAAARRMNAVLNTASLASGGGTADLRVLCDEAGDVRVDRIVSPAPITELIAAVEGSGVGAASANYTIFYDGNAAGACGVASYPDDERLAADNAANAGGGYAVAYERCWFTEGPMHEMAHTQGAVQYGAPHSTGTGGHCFEEQDVVCYSPDGGDLNQGVVVNRCSNRIQFDCGADDYFDSAPEPGEYLSEHWNLGSPLNRFISFGVRPAEASAAPLRLRQGKARRGGSASPGVTRGFWIRVPQRTRKLRITMKSPGGYDLDLYVGTAPSPGEEGYVCRSAGNSSIERCVVRHPSAGRWYAGVPTISGAAGVPFTVAAKL